MTDMSRMEPVQVALFAPIHEQPALGAWPERSDGTLRDIFALQEPHVVVLRLGERNFTSPSQLTFFKQDEGLLTAVTVQPQERTRPYVEALDELETLLLETDLLTPDVQAKLVEWRLQPPGEDTFPPPSARTSRARHDDFAVFLRLQFFDERQWFYTLEFERPQAQPRDDAG